MFAAVSLQVPRPVRAILALVVVLALAGATYQGVTTSLERRRFPHPGRLVDVGGHQLHILCGGAGTPVVVLEAPAAGLSATWARVQEPVAKLTRVCSYDRAGLGWSERGDDSFDPAHVPVELYALLDGAREQPPYIVVGDGLGSAFARMFGARFPAATRSLVLLDAPGTDGGGRDRRSLGRMPNAMPWLARVGLLRVVTPGRSRQPGVDPAVRGFMNRPDHLTRAAAELSAWDDVVRLADDAAAGGARTGETAVTLPAPLDDERGAAAASDAVIEAVTRARRAPEPTRRR